jgi:hypothetical protein
MGRFLQVNSLRNQFPALVSSISNRCDWYTKRCDCTSLKIKSTTLTSQSTTNDRNVDSWHVRCYIVPWCDMSDVKKNLGDISLNLNDARERGHSLNIHGNNLYVFSYCLPLTSGRATVTVFLHVLLLTSVNVTLLKRTTLLNVTLFS